MSIRGEKIKREFFEKANNYFKGLSFVEKSHEYYIDSKKIPISASGVVKSFEEKTDWDTIAQRIADRDGCTKEEILDIWAAKNKLACTNGTRTHIFGESYSGYQLPETAKEAAITKFFREIPSRYYLIGKELMMYHKTLNFSGTCDKLFYDLEENKFILSDWKTNEDLFKNYKNKTLMPPFDKLLDNPFNLYQIQLSLYQILIEQLGYEVSERWVVWLLPDGTYQRYKARDYSKRLFKHMAA